MGLELGLLDPYPNANPSPNPSPTLTLHSAKMLRLRRSEGLDQRASASKGLEPKSSLVIWPGEI